ncbi:MAG: O-antigen ligase family protein [Acidimicrobiales bacterium]
MANQRGLAMLLGPKPARAAVTTMLLSLAIAVFAIDPDKLLDPSMRGPERIVVVGLPLSILGAIAAFPLPSRTNLRRQPDFLGAFVAWMLVGALLGPNPALAFAYAGSFGCIALSGRRIGRYDPTLLMGSLAASLPAYLGLAVVARLSGVAQSWFFLDRLTFLSLEANQFARFAGIAALAGLYLAAERHAVQIRAVGAAVALLALVAIPITASRTAVTALLAALGVLLVRRSSKGLVVGLAAGITTVVAFVALTPVGLLLERGLSRGGASGGATTLTGRTDIWPVVLDQALTRPIAGHGVGTDRSIVSGLSYRVGFEIQHAHTLGLHVLLTTGVVGLVLFAALLWSLIGAPGGRLRSPASPWALAIVAFVLVDGVSEPVLQNPSGAWLALVAAAVLAEQQTAPKPATAQD